MAVNLNEVTPQDFYIVKINKPIYSNQISHLITMFQPIIGPNALSLYLTLINYVPFGESGISKIATHRELISKLFVSFKTIINSRKILEAIGLLETSKYESEDKDEFIYEYSLLPPLSPSEFFKSDILCLLLINRIGKNSFINLRKKYIYDLDWSRGKYIKNSDITKSFDEVFDSILSSELKLTPESEIYNLIDNFEKPLSDKHGPKINGSYLDIDFIRGMVSDLYNLKENLDDNLIKLLNELAFLYKFNESDIINLLKDHTIYDNLGYVNQDLLRNRVKEKYQYEQKEVVIYNKARKSSETDKIELNRNEDGKIESKEARHKRLLQELSPIELMKQYQSGGKIPDSDITIIEELIYDYKLNFEVINVLIEYVMLTNDYKLPKKLTEKIAGHWKRLNINSAEEALKVAKKEQQIYKNWKENNIKTNNKSKTSRAKNVKQKQEKIPEYILKQDEKYPNKSTDKDSDIRELQDNQIDKKDRIEQMLKELE